MYLYTYTKLGDPTGGALGYSSVVLGDWYNSIGSNERGVAFANTEIACAMGANSGEIYSGGAEGPP